MHIVRDVCACIYQRSTMTFSSWRGALPVLNYLVIYIGIRILWFPYRVYAAHSDYRTWIGLWCAQPQILLQKYFSCTAVWPKKYRAIKSQKYTPKPNDEFGNKTKSDDLLNREVINFHYCSDWTLYDAIYVSAPAADIFIPLVCTYTYARMVNYVIK